MKRTSIFALVTAACIVSSSVSAEALYHVGGRDGAVWACTFAKDKGTTYYNSCFLASGSKMERNDTKVQVDCAAKTVGSRQDVFSAADYEKDVWDVSLADREKMALFMAACRNNPLVYQRTDTSNSDDLSALRGTWLRLKEGPNRIPKTCSLKQEHDVEIISAKKIDHFYGGCEINKISRTGGVFDLQTTCMSEGDTTKDAKIYVRVGSTLVNEFGDLFKRCGK